jgi:hypothetical protein
MEYLPIEILEHIFGFVEDKIGVSMVCKLWNRIMVDMHEKCCDITCNDSYCLKHHLNTSNILYSNCEIRNHKLNHYVINKLEGITSHNSLNYILYLVNDRYITGNDYFALLKQFLMTNNISNTKTIKKLITLSNIINIFDYPYVANSDAIINMILLTDKTKQSEYVHYLLFNEPNNALQKLLSLQNKHIMTYADIYEHVYNTFLVGPSTLTIGQPHQLTDVDQQIKNEILEYVGQFLDQTIKDFIEK